MDVIGLQGIWPNFPGNATRRLYAIDLYHRLLQDAVMESRLNRNKHKETPVQRQRRILDQVIARITQENDDDEFVFLAL